jgi:acetyl-CoA C-acetyltransferase
MSTAYILDTVRTPRGIGRKDKGALANIHPQELFAQTLGQIVSRTGVNPADIDDVVAGCVTQANDQGANLARNAVLSSNLPLEVTGTTLNRFCGSGLQAVNFGAMGVASGMQKLVIAGGVESMSRVAMGSDGAGIDGNNETLRKKYFQVPQGISADLIATLEKFTREELDGFALSSQQKAGAALADGRFNKSLFAVKDPATGAVALDKEQYPRPQTTAEALAGLRVAFEALGGMELGPNGETVDQLALKHYPQVEKISHLHTGGNSSGIVDGAAAVLLASEEYVKANNLKPRGRIVSTATAGSEPIIMLTAPAPASLKALKLAGLTPADIDLWEINEAFAAVVLQTARKLEIDLGKVNVNGGAIALGHPLGATGAILLGTALDELERTGKKRALVTLCIGGGQGIATIIERL